MSDFSLASDDERPDAVAASSVLDRLARRLAFAIGRRLREGELRVVEPGGTYVFGRKTERLPRTITLRVHDRRLYRQAVLGGTLGFGEAYVDGYWSCDDPTALVQMFLVNREALDRLESGWARLSAPLSKLYHRRRRNSTRGSRRNIEAHYDLGNDFFASFLDPTMAYSCAIFEREDQTLEEASTAKNERICRKLALSPQDRLLEIGTGWGGFALHAASRYGCHVTTTTISREQCAFARRRVEDAGLTSRVRVLHQDYRELTGTYDKVASIEMIEAVGADFLDTYFRKCSDLLAPDGMMLLQAITIAEQLYEQARRSVDFVKRHIFPGSCLVSMASMCAAIARSTDLRPVHLEDITPHYVTTLQRWRAQLAANRDHVRALGYTERLLRAWEYYFSYCEGGFKERYIGDVQLLLTKPLCRRDSIVPQLA